MHRESQARLSCRTQNRSTTSCRSGLTTELMHLSSVLGHVEAHHCELQARKRQGVAYRSANTRSAAIELAGVHALLLADTHNDTRSEVAAMGLHRVSEANSAPKGVEVSTREVQDNPPVPRSGTVADIVVPAPMLSCCWSGADGRCCTAGRNCGCCRGAACGCAACGGPGGG